MFAEHVRLTFFPFTKYLTAFALTCGLAACSPADQPASESSAAESAMRNRAAQPAAAKVRSEHPAWPLGKKMLIESVAKAGELNAAVVRLLDTPSIENLEHAQRTWRDAAGTIERFHLFSRLGTVAPQDFHSLVDLQFNLTAWPIQPGYLDGVDDHPYSGIVFDVGMPMTPDVVREQHGMTDSSDATLGVYAIEFLLFGEQNERGPLVFRPITALNEKHLEDGYGALEELPRNRRRELLRLQAQLLVDDVARLLDIWNNSQPGSVQHRFELLTSSQQAELLQKAALALATEQLVVVANQRGTDLWQEQQLADRLAAQLDGLARFNALVNLGERVAATTTESITSLNTLRGAPPLDNKGATPRLDWQDSYTNIRELIKALNPTPTDTPPPVDQDETPSEEKAIGEAEP